MLTSADLVTTFVHDAEGEQRTDWTGLNLTTLFRHDAAGNVVSIADPRGAVTRMTYDAARRLLTTTAPVPYNDGPELMQTALPETWLVT